MLRVALVVGRVERVVVDLGQVPVLDLEPGGPVGGRVDGGWWLAPVLASWWALLVVIWVLGEILGIGWWDQLRQ